MLFRCRYAVVAALALGCSKQSDAEANSPRIGPTAPVPVDGPNPLLPSSERPENPTCIAPPRPQAAVTLTRLFENIDFAAPVGMVQAPRQESEPSGRWFVIEQRGRVQSFFEENGEASGVVTSDLTSRVHTPENLDERGLLGIALHPRFPEDPRVFLAFNTDAGGLSGQLSSFVVEGGSIDLSSEIPLLSVRQPYTNHNGGGLAFGPDGFLYSGLGDGGSGGDPDGNGQNTDTLLGAVLRLDIDGSGINQPYAIPSDNPFVESGGAPEIYAYGLRNPWRFSFDRETGEMWAGDVGQDDWEEVDVIERGGNYGWNVWEGDVCYESDSCSSDGFVAPVHVYENPSGRAARSVTGGYVYRGSALPDLVGRYVFGDHVTGEIWQLVPGGDGYSVELLIEAGFNVPSFAEGETGELYVLDYSGRVLRIDPGSNDGPENTLPPLLSLTGCVNPDRPEQITSSAIPYTVALPFWSDGAEKERFIALPDGASLSLEADGELELPRGGVTIKHFRHQDELIETRFFVRHADGEYSGYTYAWREDGSDAELVESTVERRVGELSWVYPSRGDCNQCHTAAAGRSLGLELNQLDLEHPDAGVNQLDALRRLGMLDSDQSADDLFNREGADLEQRARAYLHVNCSNCHRPSGPGRGGLDLRFGTQLSSTGLCGTAQLGALSTTTRALITPGDRAESIAYLRTNSRGDEGMPPLASREVDEDGVSVLGEWIDALEACP